MNRFLKPGMIGGAAAGVIFSFYFAVLTLVSGFSSALAQFKSTWGYVIALALGFGIQMGLYWFLKSAARAASKKMIAASGSTTTFAMISCCAHYLANILPILGLAGIATLVAQYQVKLFAFGIGFNLLGIAFVGNKIYQHKHHGMES